MKSSFYKFLVFLALTACSSEDPIGHQSGGDIVMPVFKASLEDNESRAHLTSEFSIHWNEGDGLSVFAKSSDNLQYALSDGANSKHATFQAVENGMKGGLQKGANLPFNGAVYPYDVRNQMSAVTDGCEFSFEIPAEQTYTSGSFDKGAFPMLAVSRNTSLQFKNVCGLLQLQLTGRRKIASIALKGHNNEICAGWGKGTLLENGRLTWAPAEEGTSMPAASSMNQGISATSHSQIILTCSDNGGVQLKDTPASFFISMAPVTFSEGFEVVLTDVEGRTKVLSKRSAQTLVSNQLLRMPVVHCEFSQAGLKAGKTINWKFPEHAVVGFRSGWNEGTDSPNYLIVSANDSEFPAYLVKEGTTCTISTIADDVLLHADCSGMFQQAANLQAISLDQCNTRLVANMNGMFSGCTGLAKLDMDAVDTRSVKAAAGFASMFSQVGAAVPQGCEMVLGEKFVIPAPENAAGMFSQANIRSITCTPELQQFILDHAELLGFKTITAAGPVVWYNLYTGQPMHTTKELVITHELNHFIVPQLEGTVIDARILWGDQQQEVYQKEAGHTYSSSGSYQVTLQSQEADGVSFSSIKGIQKINFSKF